MSTLIRKKRNTQNNLKYFCRMDKGFGRVNYGRFWSTKPNLLFVEIKMHGVQLYTMSTLTFFW